jgi:hypothetical protein
MKPDRRRLILHVGPPKTGTSAVQHVLRGHSAPNVYYPPIGLWYDGAHHGLVFNFFKDYRRPDTQPGDGEAMLWEIAGRCRDFDGTTVLSSEHFLDYDFEDFTRQLLTLLGRDAPAVEIVFVCRDHFERASSLYSQHIQDPYVDESRSPGEYLVGNAGSLTYMPVLERLRACGFPLHVMSYHPSEAFLPAFLDYIGFAWNDEFLQYRRNLSLSIKALVAMLAIKQVFRGMEERNLCRALVRNMPGCFGDSQFVFDPAATQAVVPLFERDRALLAAEHGLHLPPKKEAWDQDRFGLTERELAEIEAVFEGLGLAGRMIIERARRYQRNAFVPAAETHYAG